MTIALEDHTGRHVTRFTGIFDFFRARAHTHTHTHTTLSHLSPGNDEYLPPGVIRLRTPRTHSAGGKAPRRIWYLGGNCFPIVLGGGGESH